MTIEPSPESAFSLTDTLPTGAPAVTMPDDPYDGENGEEVPRIRTPLDAATMRDASAAGYREATGDTIAPALLRASWCMWCVEHATVIDGVLVHGGAVWCANLGNINARGWAGDWFTLTAAELIHGHREMITQRLRAHSGPVPGAADYWACLIARWSDAVAAMAAGDLDGVARELKAGKYYTALEVSYAKGLRDWGAEYDRRW